MGRLLLLTLFFNVTFSICLARNIIVKQHKIANGFVNFLNNVPSRSYTYEDGKILNVKKLGDIFNVEIKVKAKDLNNSDVSKYLKCLTTITDLEDNGISVQNNQYECEEMDPLITHTAENEIETNTEVIKQKKYARKTRSTFIGGEVEKDPENPHIKILAEKSLNKYLKSAGNPQTYIVLKIMRATEQIVAGSKTRIDFVASGYGYGPSPLLSCHSEVWEQSWLDKEDINVNCYPIYGHDINSRKKRSTMVGGEVEKNPEDPHVKILAEKSLNKYLKSAGNPQTYIVLKIMKATEQIVAGSKTRIDFVASGYGYGPSPLLSCHSEVWEQSWLDKEDINVNCYPIYGHEINSRKKRSTMVGGEVEKNPEDPHVKILAEKSLNKYLKSAGNPQTYIVLKIMKATEQIVAGSKTRIDFVASGYGYGPSLLLSCHSEVWEQSWLDKEDINVNCYPIYGHDINSRKKRSTMVGGEVEKNPEDPHVKILAEKSLNKYLKSAGNPQTYIVLKIMKATEQIVAGSKTRIDFVASGYGYGPSPLLSCHSEVWEQSWLDKEDINVNCYPIYGHDINSRKKRSTMVGGEVEKNPEDPHVKILAEKSLNKYLKSAGNPQTYIVLKIMKATEQIVAGSKTRIDFVASGYGYGPSPLLSCHSEVWEQSWLDKEDINVNCYPIYGHDINSRKKRSTMVGGEVEKNPEDPHVKILAEKSLNKYLKSAGNPQTYIVLKIMKATEQIVAGSKTRIDFVASGYGYGPSPLLSCHSEVWEQSWLDKEDINVNCYPIYGHDINSRKKRSTMVGGEVEKNPEDPHVKILAEKSLNKYLKSAGNPQTYIVLKIMKATEQIVAGSKTRIDFVASGYGYGPSLLLSCHSEVWEQSWLDKEDINVNCYPIYGHDINSRKKRSTMVGGEVEKNPEDPHVKILAEKSLNKYLKSAGNPQTYIVLKIMKATEQIVAGSKTRIDFVASGYGYGPSPLLSCHSEVWEQSWLDKEDINVNCYPIYGHDINSRKKRSTMVGGEVEKNPDDPHVKILAEKSLNKYLKSAGNPQTYIVLKIMKATEQIVAGSKTRIDFVASGYVYGPSLLLSCHSEVWEQSWLDKEDINVNCYPIYGHEINSRKKRSTMVGGEVEKNPEDPHVKILAEKSLNKYLKSVGNPQPYVVLKIMKATAQVVAGSMTRIDFVALRYGYGPSALLSCHSEVWEQPWRDKEEIKVTCSVLNINSTL